MLKVWMGKYIEDGVSITKPDIYFDDMFDRKLLLTDFSRRLINECSQGSKVINECQLEHPWRGYYPPELLPSGVKTTLLAKYNKEVITDMIFCGDNCMPYIVEASRDEDVIVHTERVLYLFEPICRDGAKEVLIMNNNKVVKDFIEYFHYWVKFDDSVNGK